MDFAAIDFETANHDRRSACQVGIAVVSSGKIIDTYSSLIRPPTLKFLPAFVRLHGITPQRVHNAPTFGDIWPEIEARCNSGLVAAHSAAFDVGVLTACAKHFGVGTLSGQYMCTLRLAQVLLPGLPNHKLPTLANELGIPLEHHEALSDAKACAKLAIQLASLAGPEGIGYYFRNFSDFGKPSGAITESADDDIVASSNEAITLADIALPDGRFEGLTFVFTGDLIFFSRDKASAIVESQGGKVSNSISKKTNYLVVGDKVLYAFRSHGVTTVKLAKAREIQNGDIPIQIIDASEFLTMIM